MIKRSIIQEDIFNVYAANNRAPNYVRQKTDRSSKRNKWVFYHRWRCRSMHFRKTKPKLWLTGWMNPRAKLCRWWSHKGTRNWKQELLKGDLSSDPWDGQCQGSSEYSCPPTQWGHQPGTGYQGNYLWEAKNNWIGSANVKDTAVVLHLLQLRFNECHDLIPYWQLWEWLLSLTIQGLTCLV